MLKSITIGAIVGIIAYVAVPMPVASILVNSIVGALIVIPIDQNDETTRNAQILTILHTTRLTCNERLPPNMVKQMGALTSWVENEDYRSAQTALDQLITERGQAAVCRRLIAMVQDVSSKLDP